jgi:hypothetical protein
MSGSYLDTSMDRNYLLSPEPASINAAATAAAVERGAMKVNSDSDLILAVPSMPVSMKEVTPRLQVFHELLTTESNYVAILDCVSKIAQVGTLRDAFKPYFV